MRGHVYEGLKRDADTRVALGVKFVRSPFSLHLRRPIRVALWNNRCNLPFGEDFIYVA